MHSIGILPFLIICPMVFFAGVVDAVAGGGGLISLPAYMIAGLPAHAAIATNKLSAFMGTAVATGKYIHSGYVNWRAAAWCVPAALIGSWTGAHIALLLDDRIFLWIMLGIIPVTGFYVLRGKGLSEEPGAPYPLRKTVLISMAVALAVGIYDGFYGPGTGTYLILFLTGLVHVKLQDANGMTKVINSTTNVTALVVFLMNGQVLLPLGLTAGIFGILGNYLGAVWFQKGGAKAVKPVMLAVLVIFFVKILYDVLK